MTDEEFLKKYCGDVWTETRTLPEDVSWVPQGTIIVTSGKKLQMPDRKETND